MDEVTAAQQRLAYVRSQTNDAGQIRAAQAAIDAAMKRRKPTNALARQAAPQGNYLNRLNTALSGRRQP